MKYPVIQIDNWQPLSDETMGSKLKGWFAAETGKKYLFKYPRLNSGEAWAEKAVAEIAGLLDVPHASYDLATFGGERGIISLDMVNSDEGNQIVHGNQLLGIFDPEYDQEKRWKQSEHTYARITQILYDVNAKWPEGFKIIGHTHSGEETFAGYLVLDALVSHSDRHHQNWAVIAKYNEDKEEHSVEIAPTYDHASSLGRELTDKRRDLYLQMDNGIQLYAKRCKSGIYWQESDSSACHPAELVRLAALGDKLIFSHWLSAVSKLNIKDIANIFATFPKGWMSDASVRFALELVRFNQSQLSAILMEMRS